MSFRDGGACEFLSLLASAAACCFWWHWSCESCDWGAPLSQPSSLYPNLCMHHLRRPRPPSLSREFLTWNWDCQRTSSSHVHAVDTISCGCSAGLSFLRCMTGQWDDVSRKQQMAPAAASHHARTYLCLHGWKWASQPEKIWHWYVPWSTSEHIGSR